MDEWGKGHPGPGLILRAEARLPSEGPANVGGIESGFPWPRHPSEGKPGRPVKGRGRERVGVPLPPLTFRGEARSPGEGAGLLWGTDREGVPTDLQEGSQVAQ